jgi:tryptophan synthase alpha chain
MPLKIENGENSSLKKEKNIMLEELIRRHKKEKEILLMTHLVLGYPSFEENRETVKGMVEAGVELIELQIPFSEPTADGPVILKANSNSLKNKTKVSDCLQFAEEICKAYPEVSFLFMTYYNIIFVYGEDRFLSKAKDIGIKGFIVPDLPPEEAKGWYQECKNRSMNSILIFTPTHSKERLNELAKSAGGFVYCVGRRGVTGKKTAFDASLEDQIATYRKATELPLALGFGVQEKADIDFLKRKIDIAVIGSRLIEIQKESGSGAVKDFLLSIRNT